MKKSKTTKQRSISAKLEPKATTITRLDPTDMGSVAGGDGKGGTYMGNN